MIVERIKGLCKENNISVGKLEKRLEISQGSIGRWNRITPSVDKIVAIAKFFHVTTDYLLGLELIQEQSLEAKFLNKLYKDTSECNIKWENLSSQYNEHMNLIAGCVKENAKCVIKKILPKESFEFHLNDSCILFIKYEGYEIEQPFYGTNNILIMVLNRYNLHLRTAIENFFVLEKSESFLDLFEVKVRSNIKTYMIKNKSKSIMEKYLDSKTIESEK